MLSWVIGKLMLNSSMSLDDHGGRVHKQGSRLPLLETSKVMGFMRFGPGHKTRTSGKDRSHSDQFSVMPKVRPLICTEGRYHSLAGHSSWNLEGRF